METLKKNVSQFNADVRENAGYRYSTNAPYSSIAAHARQTSVILERIPAGTRTLVDIGSGDGVYTNDVKKGRPDLEISGFDPADEAISAASKRFPNVSFTTANLLDPESLPRTMYDVGVMRGVLHHVSDPESAIRNCARVCRTLILLEPNGNNPILKIIEKTSAYHIEHEEQSFTSPTLRRWCRAGGWKVESQTFAGFVPIFSPTPFARVMKALEPVLEKIPLVRTFGAAYTVLVCTRD